MTFGGRVGPKMWGKGQSVTWWDMVKLFKTNYQEPMGTEMYAETCPCSFDPSLLKSSPHKGRIGTTFLDICKESDFVALVSDRTPGPLISIYFEDKKKSAKIFLNLMKGF